MEIIGYLNKEIMDLHDKNPNGEPISRDSILGLEILRHSCAHLMAHAILNLYKNVHFAIGPVTENGFFYDFQVFDSNNQTINLSSKDFETIEKEMKRLVDLNIKLEKYYISKEEFIKKQNDPLKQEILKNIDEQEISIYKQDNFSDLCKGPHVLSTKIIGKNFKLLNISEVSWKDHRIQRINGTCFASQNELIEFLKKQKEEKENDHRKIGVKLDLFSFNDASPGLVFWHPKGLDLLNQIKDIIRNKALKNFHEYETPLMFKNELFCHTGHMTNYQQNMFLIGDYSLKPMNCPAHALIFQSKSLSYKDLPYRIAEFGSCFRNEEQGGLMGLKRTKRLTIDDGHIFCKLEHVKEEIQNFLENAKEIYQDLGFEEVLIKLATRPENKIGDEKLWDQAEDILKDALKDYEFVLAEGDGAFYGPKIELHLKDKYGKLWQCGTIQVDFFIGKNLNITFKEKDNTYDHPIVLHRAILGSLERFTAILLENKLPFKLMPVQTVVIPISENFINYAKKIHEELLNSQIKSVLYDENLSLNKRIKKSIEDKVEFVIIIGEKEQNENNITVRFNNQNKIFQLKDFINFLQTYENT